jgi:hypothetical protein
VGLLQLDGEMQRLQFHLEYLKDRAGAWEKYERFRVETTRRYLSRTDPVHAVQAAVDVLGKRKPLVAVKLQDLSVILGSQRLSLEAFASNTNTNTEYVKALSGLEAGFEISRFSLRKLILQLAWLHGFVTWFKVRLSWRRSKSYLAKNNRQFTEKFLDEVYRFVESRE